MVKVTQMLISLFALLTMFARLVKIHPLVQKTHTQNGWFINWWPWKLGQGHQNLVSSFRPINNVYMPVRLKSIPCSEDNARKRCYADAYAGWVPHHNNMPPSLSGRGYILLRSKFLFTLTYITNSWRNQLNECTQIEDSDQPGHPPRVIRNPR